MFNLTDTTKKAWRWILITVFGLSVVSAAEILDTKDIPENLKLVTSVDQIVKEKISTERGVEVVKYTYKTGVLAGAKDKNGIDEDITKRTPEARFYKIKTVGNLEHWEVDIYPEAQFYKESDDKWYLYATATTTIDAYEAQKTSRRIIDYALADTATTSDFSGDGLLRAYSTTWATARNATDANDTDLASTEGEYIGTEWYGGGSTWYIYRGFFTWNTAVLPDDATITNATSSLYITSSPLGDNDANAYYGMFAATPADPTSLVVGDYDQCGALWSSTSTLSSITDNAFNSLVWNTAGVSGISVTGVTATCYREFHDVNNDPITTGVSKQNLLRIRASEYSGTTYDPLLTVSYTTGGAPETPAATTPQIIQFKKTY